MIVLLAIACLPKGPDASGTEFEETATVEVDRPSGMVHDGVFTDETYGLSVPLLEGWVAEAGPSSGLMRVALRHVSTDTLAEFWVFEGRTLTPRLREGCDWTFQDAGRPHSISEEVLVALCTPTDPASRRVFGTLFLVDDYIVQIETHAPNDALIEGKDAADRVIRQVRWRP